MALTTEKPIVVPWDFSEMSQYALATAIEIAESPSQIHVLHVIPYPSTLGTEVPGIGIIDEEHFQQSATRDFYKMVSKERYPEIVFEIALGDPGSQIANFAKQIKAGLIVISSHGRTGLAHLFLGSVAERVSRLSPCPVLILRGELTE